MTLVKTLCDVSTNEIITYLLELLSDITKQQSSNGKHIVPGAMITKEARGVFCFWVLTNMQ